MASFQVQGGISLKGSIEPQGAKNEALQILSAVLLTADKVTIHNLPDIIDVNLLIELLIKMGVKVQQNAPKSCTFQADAIQTDYLTTAEFKQNSGRLRGSVMLAGPMLARFHKAYIPQPGGDKIGRRRLDTHFDGFEKLGVHFHFNRKENHTELTAKNLKGCYILMDEPRQMPCFPFQCGV